METFVTIVLPVILYIVAIILLIVLTIVGLRLIKILDKVDETFEEDIPALLKEDQRLSRNQSLFFQKSLHLLH